MTRPVDDTTRNYARELSEKAMTAHLVRLRGLVQLYRDRSGNLDREDRDLMVSLIDDLDLWLCSGAVLPGEWSGSEIPRWAEGSDVVERLAAAASEVKRRENALAERREAVLAAKVEGLGPTEIARLAGISRQAVTKILGGGR